MFCLPCDHPLLINTMLTAVSTHSRASFDRLSDSCCIDGHQSWTYGGAAPAHGRDPCWHVYEIRNLESGIRTCHSRIIRSSISRMGHILPNRQAHCCRIASTLLDADIRLHGDCLYTSAKPKQCTAASVTATYPAVRLCYEPMKGKTQVQVTCS